MLRVQPAARRATHLAHPVALARQAMPRDRAARVQPTLRAPLVVQAGRAQQEGRAQVAEPGMAVAVAVVLVRMVLPEAAAVRALHSARTSDAWRR